ncbi:hypothetical protein Hanom_Chr00s189794g01834481 [Helianthus anomalus]
MKNFLIFTQYFPLARRLLTNTHTSYKGKVWKSRKKEMIREIGMLNTKIFFLYIEEIDFYKRL